MPIIVTTKVIESTQSSRHLSARVALANDTGGGNAIQLFTTKHASTAKTTLATVTEGDDDFKTKSYGTLQVDTAAGGNAVVVLTGSTNPQQKADYPNLSIQWIRVRQACRSSGYGVALMFAFCQRALDLGLAANANVLLVADEEETPGNRQYYAKFGFQEYEDEVDKPGLQFPMWTRLEPLMNALWLHLTQSKGLDGSPKYGPFHYIHR